MARNEVDMPPKHAHRIAPLLRQVLTETRRSISMLVITGCTGFFLILAVLDLSHIVSWSQAMSVLGLSFGGVVRRLWFFQFLTAPLLHADLTHLAFNMLTLWMLGPSVKGALGRRQYILFSTFCAGCSMLGFLLWSWGTGRVVWGYSGVIFGLLVAQATFFPERVLYLYAFFPLKMKHAVLVLAAGELYLTVAAERSGIAHASHVCGAVGAWVYLQQFSF